MHAGHYKHESHRLKAEYEAIEGRLTLNAMDAGHYKHHESHRLTAEYEAIEGRLTLNAMHAGHYKHESHRLTAEYEAIEGRLTLNAMHTGHYKHESHRLTAESVRMVVSGDLMFFKSHTFTVRSSLPEITLSPPANTADVTCLKSHDNDYFAEFYFHTYLYS